MIDLVSKRFIFLGISLLVILPGLIAVLAGGLKPGIDFTGGTRWEVIAAKSDASKDAFKDLLEKNGRRGSQVKGGVLENKGVFTNTVIMDIPGKLETETKAVLEKALVDASLVSGKTVTETVQEVSKPVTSTTTKSGTVVASSTVTGTITASATATAAPIGATSKQVQRTRILPSSEIDYRSVGPTVGSELLGRAFLAILAASAAILVYLTIVFRRVPNAFRYGVCAIIALLHDVLVVLGVFAILGLLFGLEIDALFVTAMLTVIGFSVHDTIVVFDRLRENIIRRKFERFDQTVNYSLVQTLARSINTSITVILTLFALYLFGGSSIRNFVLALLIGIISGTYSSIFNASMLLVIWENHEWLGFLGGRNKASAPVRGTASR